MKNYLWLASLFILAACETDIKTQDHTPSQNEKTITLYSANELTDYIFNHYHKDFKQHKQERIDTDSSIELSYLGKIDEDMEEQWLISISIPNGSNNSAIYKGDLNQDGKEDQIIAVHTEGGGGGGNVAGTDFFTFVAQDGKFAFQSQQTGSQLSGCPENYGYFIPGKIENNIFKGESYCYAEDDGRCCPSLHYNSEVVLKNSKLVHKKKTESPAPEQSL